MVITEEIIAAYIEGKVTAEERTKVRMYLVKHPEMQDLVLALMDDDVLAEDKEEDVNDTLILNPEQVFTDIAYAAAAFAPKMSIEPKVNRNTIDNISQRQQRMSSFWEELEKDK